MQIPLSIINIFQWFIYQKRGHLYLKRGLNWKGFSQDFRGWKLFVPCLPVKNITHATSINDVFVKGRINKFLVCVIGYMAKLYFNFFYLFFIENNAWFWVIYHVLSRRHANEPAWKNLRSTFQQNLTVKFGSKHQVLYRPF